MLKIGKDIISSIKRPIIKPFKESTIERLKRKKVKDVDFNGKTIRVYFNNQVLKAKVTRLPHEHRVGSWSKIGKEIFYDDDLVLPEWVISIAVHEVLEKHFKRNYGLDENYEGHQLAEHIEKKWHIKMFGKDSWRKYSKLVNKIHEKESKFLSQTEGGKFNLQKKLRKLPPHAEMVAGGLICIIPPVPDPTDVVGVGMIAHGYKRLKRKKR